MICWKIRIFAYWTTPAHVGGAVHHVLWFAEKFVSLLIEQHLWRTIVEIFCSCDLLKNSYLCLLNNTSRPRRRWEWGSCDLLKNSYLCLLNNTWQGVSPHAQELWFAEKFVSLLIEQHQEGGRGQGCHGCDLLKNSYLCLLNNTSTARYRSSRGVVICWKIRIFAYWTTPSWGLGFSACCCDLLKNSYLCLLNNTSSSEDEWDPLVVICWKIRIFAYWTTPTSCST